MVRILLLLAAFVMKSAIIISLFGSVVISSQVLALTTVTASIDKNPAMINEPIVLTIVADDDVNKVTLDTSPLLTDFIVGRTSATSYTSMVNFKTSLSTKWQIVLIARRTGKLTIPALHVKNKQSAPISLVVIEKNDDATEQQDIFVTSELSNSEIYVQQLFTLKLKLHFAVDLKSGNLSEPLLPNANIEKIGQDQQTSTIINGKRYRVIEQTYAITPEQSGKFTIDAPVFSGEIMTASKRRSSFLSFSDTKAVNVIGESKTINVRPIPDNYPQDKPWLPTEILTIHQEWPANDGTFTVGEPITRTITLTAAGLSKAQLPEILMENTAKLKVYPDQAELHTNMTKDRLVSQKIQNFAIVPSRAGTFTLPELSVTWFNTVTNKVQQSTLPAQTITVEPSSDFSKENKPTTGLTDSSNENQHSDHKTENQHAQPVIIVEQSTKLQWLLIILWVITPLLWFFHVRHLKRTLGRKSINKNENCISNQENVIHGNPYQQLVDACKHNNAANALGLIIPWINQLTHRGIITLPQGQSSVTRISLVPHLIDDQSFATALHDLQQHLYGKSALAGGPSWQGQALLGAITRLKTQKAPQTMAETCQLNP